MNPNTWVILLPLYIAATYGALIALTNIKRGYVKAYWKKENKELEIPFQQGSPIIAFDGEGNRYKMGMLFLPKKLKI